MNVIGAFLIPIPVKVGDTVELVTPNSPQKYSIVANATDLLNVKVVTVFISQINLATDFDRTDDVFVQLNLKPGVSLTSIDA